MQQSKHEEIREFVHTYIAPFAEPPMRSEKEFLSVYAHARSFWKPGYDWIRKIDVRIADQMQEWGDLMIEFNGYRIQGDASYLEFLRSEEAKALWPQIQKCVKRLIQMC